MLLHRMHSGSMLDLAYSTAQLIIQVFVDLYLLMVCLGILLHWANVSYANPILRGVSKIIHPFLKPIYSVIPTVNGVDLASMVLLSVLSMSKIAILTWFQTGYIPLSKGLFILAFAEVLKQFADIFSWVILFFSLMSWFNPLAAPALVEIVFKMGAPLLQLVRRFIPPIAGIDFSPFLVLLGLQFLMLFIVNPLSQIGLIMIKTT